MEIETITPKVGVGVLLFKTDPHTLNLQILLGQRLCKHGYGEFSLPGGHMDVMEDPEETCKREVLEETGMALNSVGKVKKFPYSNDKFHETGKHYITLFFYSFNFEGEPKNMEPDKCDGWGWYNIEQMPSPLFPPLKKIVDSGLFK